MVDIHSSYKIITALQAGRIFMIKSIKHGSCKSRSVFLHLSGTTDHLRGLWYLGCSVWWYLIFVNLSMELALGSKGGWCVGLMTLPPSCADCLEILGASTSWSLKGLSQPVMGQVYFYLYLYFSMELASCHPCGV
jgi:hypothetical protein